MSKSFKNYTTIGGIEVTDELMSAVVSWEGKLDNFFLKSVDLWKHSDSKTTTIQELGIADQQLLRALDKARGDVDRALCDSFNTSVAMRILSDLVTESNSAETLPDQTVILLARWIERIVTIFGLDPERDLSNLDRIGWSSLDISAPAKPYIYPASQLRDKVRNLAYSSSIDHTAIGKFAEEITIAASTAVVEPSKAYDQVLQQFSTNVKALASQQAPAKDLLALCDQFRDVHLWNLGIYLEDRNHPQPALVRRLDKLLVQARAERESAGTAKARAKVEKEARDAEKEKRLRERAMVDPLLLFRTSDEYSEWEGFDDNGQVEVSAGYTLRTSSSVGKSIHGAPSL
ncbi:hypothetical protein N0V90_013251 [Kalmusia sp. IMI 367209]|nr:hypothetical protein N0V90_013251 [Kalmusia sp. IMI 367209]